MGDVVRGVFPRREEAIAFVDPGPVEGALSGCSGRVPPHDLGAEAACLAAAMLDATPHEDRSPSALETCLEWLKPERFFGEEHGRIWQAIEALSVEKSPIDVVTVARWLEGKGWLGRVGGTFYLAQLADATPSVGNVAAHCQIVVERWEDRLLIATCQRVAVEGYEPDAGEGRATFRAAVRAEIGRQTALRPKLAGVPIGVAVQESRAQLEAQPAGKILGVSWGLAPLDAAFGPLAQKEQHVIGGLSEHGKTALAAQVAVAVAQTPLDALGVGEAVYVLSGEMKREQFAFRLACSMAGVDAATVKLGAAGDGALEDLGWWMGWLAKLPIVIDDDPVDARTMARRIREHQREFAKGSARRADGELHPKCRLRTVLADHVQKLARLCSGCGPRADTKERIAAVSHGWLHHVAKGLDVATVLLAQVRRDVLDAQRGQKGRIVFPRAAHLEGASELGQDADTIAIVHRPELPLLEADEEVPAKWLDVAAVIPGKRRWGGARGLVKLGYRLGRFSEDLPAAARGEAHYGT